MKDCPGYRDERPFGLRKQMTRLSLFVWHFLGKMQSEKNERETHAHTHRVRATESENKRASQLTCVFLVLSAWSVFSHQAKDQRTSSRICGSWVLPCPALSLVTSPEDTPAFGLKQRVKQHTNALANAARERDILYAALLTGTSVDCGQSDMYIGDTPSREHGQNAGDTHGCWSL